MTTAPLRTRAEIEAEIVSKRRERELYVSDEGVARCHAAIDGLLSEWEASWSQDEKPLPVTQPLPNA